MMLTKNNFWIIIILSLLFIKCKNDSYLTKIDEIDENYNFLIRESSTFDSIYTNVELFYLNDTKDSIYTIATAKKDKYIDRARGWVINSKRYGDWYYEKVYNNQIIIDSIVNYVAFCDKNPINTIKKFKNNYLDSLQGYYHDIELKNNVFLNDTLSIKINFNYDTIHFQKVASEFYMFNPPSVNDYCYADKYVIDSFPIHNNSTNMSFIMDGKGKTRFLGYYYLIPKKQRHKKFVEQLPVFTEINFEVK